MTPAQIKAIRARLGLTQMDFAILVGCSIDTLRGWEQGRSAPEQNFQARLSAIDSVTSRTLHSPQLPLAKAE